MTPRQVVDVIVRPEYIVRYEQWDDHTLVHADFRQWNARIARQFRTDIDAAQRLLGREVHAIEQVERPNQVKFLLLHGFIQSGVVTDDHGRRVAIFTRPIDGFQPIRRWVPEHHPDH